MRFLFVLLAAFAAVGSWAQPAIPNSYHMIGTMELPYAEIREPVEVWYDSVNGHSRVDFYNGLDSYIYRADMNITWQVNPMINTKACFTTEGEVNLVSYMPDLTNFKLQSANVMVGDIPCNDWQYVETIGSRINTYDFYVSAATGKFIQYKMMGFDSLLGSHYDEYLVNYDFVEVIPFTPDAAVFAEPNTAQQCGDFPGPGVTMHSNPMAIVQAHTVGSHVAVAEVTEEFRSFMQAHGKSYNNKDEVMKRQQNYFNNKAYVENMNRKYQAEGKTMRMALNHLADLTEDEMLMVRGLNKKRHNNRNIKATHHIDAMSTLTATRPVSDLPAAFDWRLKGAVNPPKDQGVCGSCWSFGTAGTLEGSYFLATGKLIKLSEQSLMDCSWTFGNNACDGGEDFRAYGWIMQNGGIPSTADYGEYLMADGMCHASSVAKTLTLNGYMNITQGDETAVMQALVEYGPISISIDASHRSLSFYSSGVYNDPECKNGPDDLDHSVLLVGYGTEAGQDYWIIKNSWSTYWGDGGYVKMARAGNLCGVATAATVAQIKPLK